MRRSVSLVSFLLGISINSYGFFGSDIVYDPTNHIVNEVTAVKTAETAVTEAQSLIAQGQQLTLEIQNTLALPQQIWRDTSSIISEVDHTIEQGKALAYSMQNVDQVFQSRYTSFQGSDLKPFIASFNDWSQTTLDTLRGTLDAASVNVHHFAEETHNLKALMAQNQSVQGRQQAQQVSNEIAAEHVQQVQDLRHEILQQTNAEDAYMAYQVSKDTYEQKSLEALAQHTDSTFPQYHNDRAFGPIPSFS